MTQLTNQYGQPIGTDVTGWNGAQVPTRSPMQGRFCRLEPLLAHTHLPALYEAFAGEAARALWTYMSGGPFDSQAAMGEWMEATCSGEDPLFYAIVDTGTGKASGMAAYLRIKPDAGVVEVGHIAYSPLLQRTAQATEAMFLMMQRAFDELGYRRYEWKCDALNAASRNAAERLGFCFDGVFRQALVYKGRNRDTAWYSILDGDWPRLRAGYRQWLDPANFDPQGRQLRKLQHFTGKP